MTYLDSPELRYCAEETLWLAATMGLDGVFAHVAKQYRAPSLNYIHLSMACLAGHAHAVELFGSFVHHWQCWDEALICAARSGNAALVKSILPKSNARAHGSQALVEACGVGSLEVVRLLLPHSLQIAAAARALPLAAARGEVAIVAEIMASPLPDRQTACYRAWEYALKYGHADCAAMLSQALHAK